MIKVSKYCANKPVNICTAPSRKSILRMTNVRIEINAWYICWRLLFGINHGDVIKRKHFPRDWPFVWWIYWSTVNSPHKGQWRGALMLTLIRAWINAWANTGEAGDLRRHNAYYDVIVMIIDLDTRVAIERVMRKWQHCYVYVIRYPCFLLLFLFWHVLGVL